MGSGSCYKRSDIDPLSNANILNILGLSLLFVATVARPVGNLVSSTRPFHVIAQYQNVFRVVVLLLILAGVTLVVLAMRKDDAIQDIMRQSDVYRKSGDFLSTSGFSMTLRGFILTQAFLTFVAVFLIPLISSQDPTNKIISRRIILIVFSVAVLLLGTVAASFVQSIYINSRIQTGISKARLPDCIQPDDIFNHGPRNTELQMVAAAAIVIVVVGGLTYTAL
jgi:hypothetical protein